MISSKKIGVPGGSQKLPDDVVVVDSSVWISALVFGGVPLLALRLAATRGLVSSSYIRSEVMGKLVSKFGWMPEAVEDAMNLYLGSAPDIETQGDLRGAVRDPKDDMVLECALIAKAAYLITGDRDLLFIEVAGNCITLTPRAYLQLAFQL